MAEHTIYSTKSMDKIIAEGERLAPGHRACIGCGEALAVRLACKALGDNVIIANATGCIEIISSQLPYTSWTVPWIHTLFENTAAVASGIEAGLKVLTRKGRRTLPDVKAVAMAGEPSFFTLVRAGFSAARKQIGNSLAQGLDLPKTEVRPLLEAAGIAARRRAETLDIQEWAQLWQVWASSGRLPC